MHTDSIIQQFDAFAPSQLDINALLDSVDPDGNHTNFYTLDARNNAGDTIIFDLVVSEWREDDLSRLDVANSIDLFKTH
jgi:hypothetical protein